MTHQITPERIAELLAIPCAPVKLRLDGEKIRLMPMGQDHPRFPVASCGYFAARRDRPASVLAAAPELHAALAQVSAENERLREALFSIVHTFTENMNGDTVCCVGSFYQSIARAAMNPEGDNG